MNRKQKRVFNIVNLILFIILIVVLVLGMIKDGGVKDLDKSDQKEWHLFETK